MRTAKRSSALLLLAGLLLAGCGGGETGGSDTQVAETLPDPTEESRTLGVAMDGWDSAEAIGVVIGTERELFSRAGLEVTTYSPASPAYSIPDVINGTDQIAVARAPQAVVARAKGAPIVIVGSLVPQATAALIWTKDSGIADVADLKGKTIAIPALSFQQDFLEAILARSGLSVVDVRIERVGNDLLRALLDGQADAIFGGSANQEGAELETRGVEPVVTSVRDAGIPDYEELVLVAREDRYDASPRAMQDFVATVADGAAAAVADPEAAARALNASGESNPETSAAAFRAAVEQTVPLLSEDGEPDEEKTEELVEWMYDQGIIDTEPSASELLAGS